MRTMFAVLLALLMLAPAAVAETTEAEGIEPLDHPADGEDHDSPAFGLLALVGVVAGVALLRRK